jgi:hypothetical protein
MYASDIVNKNRAATLYQNFLLKQADFDSGKSIRIERQSGGIDYSYTTHVLEGLIEDKTYLVDLPLYLTLTNSILSTSVNGLTSVNLSLYTDSGSATTGTLDDANIPISTNGSDFYFFGVNSGATNKIWWNTNNALVFNNLNLVNNTTRADISATTCPAILLGQYDRRLKSLYTTSYTSQGFAITKITVNFDNYYTSSTTTGSFMVRLIREIAGDKRQWVEVTVIESPLSPGYSTQITTYPSGAVDSDGNAIDPTKLSPYNITDGTQFFNPCGTQFGLVSPSTGSSFVFQSNSYGSSWVFYNTCFLNVY